MTATVGMAAGDPRLWVEDTLSAELGVEKVMVVRLRDKDVEFAYATIIKLGAEGSGALLRLTESDCRSAAEAFDLLADELGKRKAEKKR